MHKYNFAYVFVCLCVLLLLFVFVYSRKIAGYFHRAIAASFS